MPPFVSRKRSRSPICTAPEPPSKRRDIRRAQQKAPQRPTAADNQAYLQNGHESDESSLSSAPSETVESQTSPSARQPPNSKPPPRVHHHASESDSSDSEQSEQEENTWDDFLATHDKSNANGLVVPAQDDPNHIELTLDQVQERSRQSLIADNGKKKGPSAIEKRIRAAIHCVHVQCLMYHNTIRNGWTCNKNVQNALVDGLSTGCKTEVNQWREACGAQSPDAKIASAKPEPAQKARGRGKKGKNAQNHRDWGHSAADPGSNVGIQSDPTLKLLKMLSAYWRKRFTTIAPGYRKQGHKEPIQLAEEVKSWQQDKGYAERFRERIESVDDFVNLARTCTGSRDVGAQLFTALLRGLGLEARMVASLQPLGFGWSKIEEAATPSKQEDLAEKTMPQSTTNGETSKTKTKPKRALPRKKPEKPAALTRSTRSGGAKEEPINLDELDSPLSSPPESGSEDSSIIELSPSKPSKRPIKKYDRDLQFPVYWTEVLSPVTQTWIAVDPIVLSVVSSSPESHYVFEPRGAVADRAKQVMCYVLAYAADGTAKDVTVRYLRKHIWPGKTKGARMPPEKVAVYNRRGKIKKYEDYDWFKTAISPYTRDSRLRKPAEQIEDAKELIPVIPVDNPNKAANLPHSSLSWYKSSAEFVLARHLRREEALLPGAKQVRTFTIGKGDAAVEEPVYKRKDVVACKTAESWHKEGRGVKEDEHDRPLKHVPMRAVTLLRKREIEENERLTGEKMQQPLYSRAQTDWIVPPPIENGIIPKNAFGNMDVYVPSMVPKGAVHIPLRGTAKICKRMDIEFAEACTGFEFGNKRAVPVLTGVVVAQENEDAVIDAWEIEAADKKRKEDEKRQKLVLGTWRKLWTGLKIVERVKREYGEGASVEAHVAKALKKADRANERAAARPSKPKPKVDANSKPKIDELASDMINEVSADADENMGGGFVVEDENGSSKSGNKAVEDGGGFMVDAPESEREVDKPTVNGYAGQQKPVSLQALHQRQSLANGHCESDSELSDPPLSPASSDEERESASSSEGGTGSDFEAKIVTKVQHGGRGLDQAAARGRGRGRPRGSARGGRKSKYFA